MKNFKVILLSIALLVGIGVGAQDKKVTFGIKGGLNMSNMYKDMKGDPKAGVNIGATLDYAMRPNVSMMTGLEYSLEGTKDKGVKLNISYLKLPVHFGYKMPTSNKNIRIVFHGGPYMAYALSGDYKFDGFSFDVFNDNVAKIMGFKMKRFDMGLGIGIGAEINKIWVGMNWDYGLLNLVDVKDRSLIYETTEGRYSEVDGKNMNATLSIGYKF